MDNEIIRIRDQTNIMMFFKIFSTMKFNNFGNLINLRFDMDETVGNQMNRYKIIWLTLLGESY
jgi:hypothetical protein